MGLDDLSLDVYLGKNTCLVFIYVEADLPPFFELFLSLFPMLCNSLENFSIAFSVYVLFSPDH